CSSDLIDRVEIQSRRPKVLDRSEIGLLLADGGQIQRDVVIDELTQISEACRDLGIVPGDAVRIGILHCVRHSCRGPWSTASGWRPGNIRPNMPGSSCPDSASRNARVGWRPAVPWPGRMSTFSAVATCASSATACSY